MHGQVLKSIMDNLFRNSRTGVLVDLRISLIGLFEDKAIFNNIQIITARLCSLLYK